MRRMLVRCEFHADGLAPTEDCLFIREAPRYGSDGQSPLASLATHAARLRPGRGWMLSTGGTICMAKGCARPRSSNAISLPYSGYRAPFIEQMMLLRPVRQTGDAGRANGEFGRQTSGTSRGRAFCTASAPYSQRPRACPLPPAPSHSPKLIISCPCPCQASSRTNASPARASPRSPTSPRPKTPSHPPNPYPPAPSPSSDTPRPPGPS